MALLSKKTMNFAYGMGAAVVIIGALFKITHLEFGLITGNLMLTIGLVVEAAIFALSAFEPVDDELDWSLVYPELAGGVAKQKGKKSLSSNPPPIGSPHHPLNPFEVATPRKGTHPSSAF